MNKRLTKRQIHQQMKQEIAQFLDEGGEVHEFQNGESGLVNGKIDNRSNGFEQGKQQRTPLNQVLNALDERKKTDTTPVTKAPRRPYKKIIYDDFGEPIREVWIE